MYVERLNLKITNSSKLKPKLENKDDFNMEIQRIEKKGTVTTKTSVYLGPLGNIIGVIIGIIVTLVGLGLSIFTILSYIQDNKTNNYIETQATIIGHRNDVKDMYIVSYVIDKKTYTYGNVFGLGEMNNGQTITIRYNPNNFSEITWGDKKTHIIFPFVSVFFLLLGISSIIHNTQNFLHFINPNKYEASNNYNVETTDSNISDYDMFNDRLNNSIDETPDGKSTWIKF